MVTPKHNLYLPLAIALLSVGAVNAGIAIATRHSIPRQVMANANRSRAASVLALGNSLVAAGFNGPVFNVSAGLDSRRGAANIAMGSSTPVEQLLLLRFSFQQGVHPRILLYGFFDFQLTDGIVLSTSELVGNRAMLYYVEPDYGRQFYQLSPRDGLEFTIMKHVPMFADRGAVWAKVERLRRSLAQYGMPVERMNRFGRAGDFALLEASSVAEFIERCQSGLQSDLNPAVREIIEQSSAAGAQVVFIEMPMSPAHLRSFYETPAWKRYRKHLQELLDTRRVTYIDASHWIGDGSLFADSLHLSEEGAERFSRRLGAAVGSSHLVQNVMPSN
jgi:hypothetical protein